MRAAKSLIRSADYKRGVRWRTFSPPAVFRLAVLREMFGACRRLELFGVIALQPAYIHGTHFAGQEWIFAPDLLSAFSARIAEELDIRRPDGQPLEYPGRTYAAQCVVLLSADLITNR